MLIVNTCAFIDSAKQESIDTILEMARHKTDGSCKRLIVTGCMAERYRDELKKEIPEIDAVLGTGAGAGDRRRDRRGAAVPGATPADLRYGAPRPSLQPRDARTMHRAPSTPAAPPHCRPTSTTPTRRG